MTKTLIFILVLLAAFISMIACSGASNTTPANSEVDAKEKKADKKRKDKDKEQDAVNDETKDTAAANPSSPDQCDKDLWKRVYESDRLEVKADCKTVTGTIAERNADEDGDEHMLLKLDPGQDDLLTKKNVKKKDGDLVIEAVCVNTPDRKKVGDTCDGYSNAVHLPQVGDHVTVTGSFVADTHNGWNEIHPITSISLK